MAENIKKEKIIGIDLGTSNSEASVMMGGRPTIVPSAEGLTEYGKAFPSVVAFTKDGQILVGEPARRQIVSNPQGTITAVKRKIGTDFKYEIYGKTYTPQQISANILQKIKRDTEEFLGEKVSKVVITVPAYFNDNQRQATKDAGKIAGLDVVRLVNEPTAAAMAYGLDKKEVSHKILVFDLGGGTLDVTVMDFDGGIFTVLSTAGDTQLGGTDMDSEITKGIIEEFKSKEGINLEEDDTAVQRIKEAAEKAKIELSSVLETEINLPFISATDKGPKHLKSKLTRIKLERLIAPIIERCKTPLDGAIKDSKLEKEKIDKIILVGGPTRMPVVREFVEKFLNRKAERGIDPMECVASGASIQGAILAGEIKDLVLLDVTPLTLGIETLGNISTPLIDRNTTIPVKKSQIFSTAMDSQNAVTINVLQGERPMAKDNTSLGSFNLVGIPPAPRGIPQIELTFNIDSNGILNVSAKDLGTGKEQKMTITASTKLSEEEVNKMIKEAEENEEKDKKRKENVEIKNNLDSSIYTAEKTLSDLGEKLKKEEKEKIETALKKAKEISKGDNLEEIKKETENLQKIIQEAGASVYQEAAKKQEEENSKKKNGESTSEKKDEKVVDADFKVDEEKEKL